MLCIHLGRQHPPAVVYLSI